MKLIKRLLKKLLIKLNLFLIKPFNLFLYRSIDRKVSGFNKYLKKCVSLNVVEILKDARNSNKRIFIDCGVNEGFVLYMFRKLLKNYFSYSGFEIQNELINLARKKNPKIEIFNKAVGIENNLSTMYITKSSGYNFRGGSSINPKMVKEDNLFCKRQIETINFIDYLINLRKIHSYDFICVKMDIEGGEYDIIDKLYEYYEKYNATLVDDLIIEFHPRVLDSEEDQIKYERKLNIMGTKTLQWI